MARVVVALLSDLYHETRLRRMVDSLVQTGHSVTILATELENEDSGLFADHTVIRIAPARNGRRKLYYFLFMWNLWRKLPQIDADIYLAVDPPALFPMALRRGVRALIYDSREFFVEMGTVVNRPVIRKIWFLLERYGLRRVTAWFSVCDSINREMADIYNVTPGSVIRNVPHSLDAQTRTDYLRSHFNIPVDNFLLLYQGGLWAPYDFTPLNEAVSQMKSVSLVYLGDGPALPRLRQWVSENGCQHQIHFHSRVTPDRLPAITASADAGTILVPNLGKSYYYLLPNKLFEYIQAGIPVLTSDFPEMSRVVNDYRVGETADPESARAIQSAIGVMQDSVARNVYREGLERGAKEFNWSVEEQKLLTIFRKVGV